MSKNDAHDEFVLLLIGAQTRLYAYILSLVLEKDRAREVLQQANLVLLEKESDFERGTNFTAWAHRVAFYEVLADRRNRVRDRHHFSDELLALIAQRASATDKTFDARSEALESCLEGLSRDHRRLVMERYGPGGSVTAIAEQVGKSPSAVSALLYRIRAALIACIGRKIQENVSS